MVIGNGMLAKAFNTYENNSEVTIFASGVSNSKETCSREFDREKELLQDTIDKTRDGLFVYFSTCSIEDEFLQNSKYVLHKIEMEKMIQAECPHYNIFRLPQVVGHTESPTLVNFLTKSIQDNQTLMIQKNAYRNLIDVDDVVKIVDSIIKKNLFINSITNIASSHHHSVLSIVNYIEKILQKKANYKLVEGGGKQNIDLSKIMSMKIDFDIFSTDYTQKILQKYLKNAPIAHSDTRLTDGC